jgi:hypothetical protein
MILLIFLVYYADDEQDVVDFNIYPLCVGTADMTLQVHWQV